MLNSRAILARKNWFLGLGIVGIVAIASTLSGLLFSLEQEWRLVSIITMMIGGTLLFVNLRKSFALAIEQPTILDRSFLFKELQQTQQAIAKIADPTKRKTFNEQSDQIANSLQKNQFKIVVFGTGSAGKTSVINALLNRKVGKIAATIGTTIARQEYTYQGIGVTPVSIMPIIHPESKVKRQISLLDTPGMQEIGAMGQQRELEALQLARDADLLIFVTSGDLTATEYRELDRLAGLGKRVILAFNKIDLYLPSDREGVLTKLKQRTQQFLAEIDIVAIAAQPSPIKVSQYANSEAANALQEWWENIPPDVVSLKERIEMILSHEWEDLLISNTHLQIEDLLQKINITIKQERRQDATKLINRYQLIAATTVFANPIPAFDLLAGAAINTQMLIDLAKIYAPDYPLKLKQAKQFSLIIAGQLLQLGCIEIATSAIASCFKLNAITYAIGGSMQAVTAAYLTQIGGISFIEYLEQQPTTQAAISSNPEMTNRLKQICQQTFKSLQSDRFFMELVTSIAN